MCTYANLVEYYYIIEYNGSCIYFLFRLFIDTEVEGIDTNFDRSDGMDGLSKYGNCSFDSSDDDVTMETERIRFKAIRNTNKKKKSIVDEDVNQCKYIIDFI